MLETNTDWGPGSVLYDYETVFDDRGWIAYNYDERNAGPLTVRRALGNSLNVPAVKSMHITGMDTVHQFAYKAGIETPFPCKGGCGIASAIGAGTEVRLDELSNAYATFSRGGVYLPLTYIDQVYDAKGRLLRQWRQRPERVFRAETAYLLNHILADKSARYTTAYDLNSTSDITMAVKTGTDDNYRNNWIIGYTKSVVFGTWIGNHDEAVGANTFLQTVGPKALMLKPFIEDYHQGMPLDKKNHWSRPAGIKEVEIDLITGYQATAETDDDQRPSRVDIFPSWYVPEISSEAEQDVEVDIVSGRLAGLCTPERAILRARGVKIRSEIDADDPFYDNWQTPILIGLRENLQIIGYTGAGDHLHDCNDRPPRIELISQPASCSTVCRLEIEINAGTFNLQQVNVIHNHQILADGAIEIKSESKSQRLTYEYEPFTVDSPAEVRGALTIEVVDTALYDAKVDVLLNIDGFPAPTLPEAGIQLTALDVDQDSQALAVSWNRLAYGLELKFDGACADQANVYLPGGVTNVMIDLLNFPSGECEAYIIDADRQVSNRLTFYLDKEPNLDP